MKDYQDLHKEVFELIDKYSKEAYSLESQLSRMLGQDDPIVNRFGYVMVILENLCGTMLAGQQEGKPINPDERAGLVWQRIELFI